MTDKEHEEWHKKFCKELEEANPELNEEYELWLKNKLKDEQHTKEHYQDMVDRNPNGTFGFSLAANAVCAARYGCYVKKQMDREWREIATRLKNEYGDMLTAEELKAEMEKEDDVNT